MGALCISAPKMMLFRIFRRELYDRTVSNISKKEGCLFPCRVWRLVLLSMGWALQVYPQLPGPTLKALREHVS